MAKIKMWIVLFIVGIVMILGASEFSRLGYLIYRYYLLSLERKGENYEKR